MAICLVLGGVTTEMAIKDLNAALTLLITSLLAQGVDTQTILKLVNCTIDENKEQLELLNARTEEAYQTTITKEDLENDTI